jgi:hypothetical protein
MSSTSVSYKGLLNSISIAYSCIISMAERNKVTTFPGSHYRFAAVTRKQRRKHYGPIIAVFISFRNQCDWLKWCSCLREFQHYTCLAIALTFYTTQHVVIVLIILNVTYFLKFFHDTDTRAHYLHSFYGVFSADPSGLHVLCRPFIHKSFVPEVCFAEEGGGCLKVMLLCRTPFATQSFLLYFLIL